VIICTRPTCSTPSTVIRSSCFTLPTISRPSVKTTRPWTFTLKPSVSACPQLGCAFCAARGAIRAHQDKPAQVPRRDVSPGLPARPAPRSRVLGLLLPALTARRVAAGRVPEGAVNWVLTAISLDYIGRPEEAKRAFQTVLRLGPSARIAAWVDIYMLSALVKVGDVARAVYRYQQLVGPLSPYRGRATSQGGLAGGAVGAGEWSERWEARHTGSGWLWDPRGKRAIRLNMHRRALEAHPSFWQAALHHRQAFQAVEAEARRAAPASGPPATRALERLPDADEDWAREALRALQHPVRGCSQARALVVELGRRDGRTGKIGTEIHGFGFGAQMHVLTIALSYAVRTGRLLVMRAQVNRVGKDAVGQRPAACFRGVCLAGWMPHAVAHGAWALWRRRRREGGGFNL